MSLVLHFGKESIAAGIRSIVIAFIAILAFMLVYYNTSGIIADIALILQLIFHIGVLASLGATLTLSGIAGIVLTMGMAVDANVLIHERIKEELAKGKKPGESCGRRPYKILLCSF
jgi:SecD/SecF fusion protein